MEQYHSRYVDGSLSLIANAKPRFQTHVEHELSLPILCSHSRNPAKGSVLKIAYTAKEYLLELFSLESYITAYYRHGVVRDMEYFVQAVTDDCAQALNNPVMCTGEMIYNGLNQRQTIRVSVDPAS